MLYLRECTGEWTNINYKQIDLNLIAVHEHIAQYYLSQHIQLATKDNASIVRTH